MKGPGTLGKGARSVLHDVLRNPEFVVALRLRQRGVWWPQREVTAGIVDIDATGNSVGIGDTRDTD
ncbi:hypothetical protein SALBM311S_11827 [Streptomyces alboniger]